MTSKFVIVVLFNFVAGFAAQSALAFVMGYYVTRASSHHPMPYPMHHPTHHHPTRPVPTMSFIVSHEPNPPERTIVVAKSRRQTIYKINGIEQNSQSHLQSAL